MGGGTRPRRIMPGSALWHVRSCRKNWISEGDRMQTYILLLRGINVGSRSKLLMKDLVAALENVGCWDVATYIQSGNAVLRSEERDAALLADAIRAEIGKRHGFEPRVLLLESDEMARAIRSNPFPEAESEPKTL